MTKKEIQPKPKTSNRVIQVIEVADTLGTGLEKSTAVIGLIKDIVEFAKFQQEQATKRQEINMKRDVLVKAIQAEQSSLEKFIAERFEERKAVFEQLFHALNTGIKKDNRELIEQALTGIIDTVKDSPIKDIDQFKNWFYDPNGPILKL